jgi:hypothetical protein
MYAVIELVVNSDSYGDLTWVNEVELVNTKEEGINKANEMLIERIKNYGIEDKEEIKDILDYFKSEECHYEEDDLTEDNGWYMMFENDEQDEGIIKYFVRKIKQ